MENERYPLEAIRLWRRQLVQGLLWVTVGLGLVALLAASYHEISRGTGDNVPFYALAYSLLVFVTFWRRAPYLLQVSVILATFYSVAVLVMLSSGLDSDGPIFLLTTLILGMLFLGRESGLALLALCVVTMLVFGVAFASGTLGLEPERIAKNNLTLSSWLSSATVFLLLSALVLLSQSFVFRQLLTALTRSHELTERLERTLAEHQHAETALANERNLLRTIIDLLPDSVYAKDREGRKLLVNRVEMKYMGVSSEAEALGKDDFEVYPEAIAAQYYADDQAVIVSGEPLLNREESIVLPDGTQRWLLTSKVPLHDSDGEVVGLVGLGHDITQRVRLERMMLQSAKMASVGGLAAGVAHEINGPISAIMQSAQIVQMILDAQLPRTRERLLQHGVDPDGLADYLKARGVPTYLNGLREVGDRVAKIVTDLLNFSRKSVSDACPHDVNALIDQTLELAATDYDLTKGYDFRDIDVVCDLAPDLPEVICSGQQIQQVILNLVRNAAQSMTRWKRETGDAAYRPRLVLRTSLLEGEGAAPWVRVEVEDNGPGIPDALRGRLFEPFFTTKGVGEGTGLGLWLCWSIVVERHHGRIWAESGDAGGARFVVDLPLTQENNSSFVG